MPHNHDRNHGERALPADKRDEGDGGHFPDANAHIIARDRGGQTIVSVIYVTAAPTFDGPIGGYSTGNAPSVGNPVQQSTRPAPIPQSQKPTTLSALKQNPTSTLDTTAKDTPTTISASSSAIDLTSSSQTINTASNEAVLTTSTSSITPSSAGVAATPSSGMSGGAKAGLALGILVLVGLLLGAILLLIRKKKEREFAEIDNEKAISGNPGFNTNPPPTSSIEPTPPQINMRPMTQFTYDLGGNRTSSGTLLGGGAAATRAARNVAGQELMDRNHEAEPVQNPLPTPPKAGNSDSNPFNDPVDPFGNQASTSAPVSPAMPPADIPAPLRVHTPTPEPVSIRADSPENANSASAISGTSGATAEASAAVVAGAAAGAVAAQTKPRGRKPAHLEHISNQVAAPTSAKDAPPPSPAMSFDSVSVASGVAVSAVGPGPNNVYRVQLDFKPSMDDEMELRAGQLVRLVHEYDDGWTLCVRLDRSQQGVAPRTCLSARPVKPRPRGPPPGSPGPRGPPMMGPPGSRPMSPANGRMSPGPNGPRYIPYQNGRPGSPSTGYRPSTSQGHPISPLQFPQVPRSLSPGPGGRIPAPRSMSPGPYGPGGMQRPAIPGSQRRRSNSASGAIGRVHSPPGPSSLRGPVQQSSQPQPLHPELQAKPVLSLAALTRPIERKPLPSQAQESTKSA